MRAGEFHTVFGQDADFWGEHPEHALEDWQYEVENGDTRLGYWDWVATRIEQGSDEKALTEGPNSEPADELASEPDNERLNYVVIQEGGSSCEAYLHVSDTEAAAEAFREDCWENGAYRTTPVMIIESDENGRIGWDEAETLMQAAAARNYE